jgi:hypothetical protein
MYCTYCIRPGAKLRKSLNIQYLRYLPQSMPRRLQGVTDGEIDPIKHFLVEL